MKLFWPRGFIWIPENNIAYFNIYRYDSAIMIDASYMLSSGNINSIQGMRCFDIPIPVPGKNATSMYNEIDSILGSIAVAICTAKPTESNQSIDIHSRVYEVVKKYC